MKQDFDKLIATKQYVVAAWRLIEARHDTSDAETVRKVSEIVGQAIKDNCASDVAKIMKAFDKWVDQETSESAVTLLNETTVVDLCPDTLDL